MSIKLYSYGAAQEVTGSKHCLEVNGEKILIDCGSFQGHRKEAEEKNRNFPFDATEISASICTHGHFDHCGSYPVLVKNGFIGNIYTTPASRDIMSLIMMDSAYIQAKDIEYLKKKAEKKGEKFDKKPIYDSKDVIKTLEHVVTISKNRLFYLSPDIQALFYNAGHILGSTMALLIVKDEERTVKIGFTGDLGRVGLPILKDPEILPEIDYLICESTYGNRLHDELGIALDELAEIINETYARNGKVIIPAFAIERTQELIYYLHLLKDRDEIPDIPIYVDSPMATNATSIFRVHPECYDEEIHADFIDKKKKPFGFEGLNYVTNVAESKALNASDKPMIVISSSGMCEAGRILHHLLNNIENPNNTILIVGFMAQHTLGRRIADKEPRVKIFGDWYNVNARVKILNAFSAHADYNEIKDYIYRLHTGKLKKVFLVHGEKNAQASLAEMLESELGLNVEAIKYDTVYNL